MARRFHLYPVNSPDRRLISAQLIRDRDLVPGVYYYTMRVGVASGDRVDYYGTFDGSQQKMVANKPFDLFSGSVALRDGESVVLDVEAVGLPPDLEAMSCCVEVGHGVQDPGYRQRDRGARDAMDAVADHFRDTRAGIELVNVLLPKRILDTTIRQEYHEEYAVVSPVTGIYPIFSVGQVTLSMAAASERPVIVMLTAHATFRAILANAILYLAITDGTNNRNPHYQQIATIGDYAHVATSYAQQITGNVSFSTAFAEQVGGSVEVYRQSLTATLVET